MIDPEAVKKPMAATEILPARGSGSPPTEPSVVSRPAGAVDRPDGDASAILASLRRMAIVSADQLVRFTALAGGVSSDIYRVDLPDRTICVKRALARLKVAADWRAPVERNRWEVEWMRVAGGIVPDAVPEVLGEDRDAGCFAMAYLGPDDHPVWKALLAEGRIDPATAARVGDTLGRIHAATADRADVAARFATDAIFHAIRLEPYLVATARAHPDLAPRYAELVAAAEAHKRVLVHGDFSPKNILVGPTGPVILDAECAWYGDPAFDLAFVLNHLLLKGARRPAWRARYDSAFAALAGPYLPHVGWEAPEALEARTAALLPALMLARIDGKSPVEYLTAPQERDAVRAFARPLVREPEARLARIAARWVAVRGDAG
jgi:aminoglycoside phosphotransferase (APT) family kinase protein